jgi:hypothetical protein
LSEPKGARIGACAGPAENDPSPPSITPDKNGCSVSLVTLPSTESTHFPQTEVPRAASTALVVGPVSTGRRCDMGKEGSGTESRMRPGMVASSTAELLSSIGIPGGGVVQVRTRRRNVDRYVKRVTLYITVNIDRLRRPRTSHNSVLEYTRDICTRDVQLIDRMKGNSQKNEPC